MSSGGRRNNAGRPGWRPKLERTLRLDLRELRRGGYLFPGGDALGLRYISITAGADFVEVGIKAAHDHLELSYRLPPGPWRNERIAVDRPSGGFRKRVRVVGRPKPMQPVRWLICPDCQKQRRALFLRTDRDHFACRFCHDLIYEADALSPLDRLARRRAKLVSRIIETPKRYLRPKGMHERTFDAIVDQIEKVEDAQEREREKALMRALRLRLPDTPELYLRLEAQRLMRMGLGPGDLA